MKPRTKAEKRAAEAQRQARMARMAQDPNYIKGDVVGVDHDRALTKEDIDDIEVKKIPPNTLPMVRKEDTSDDDDGRKKKRKKVKRFKVRRDIMRLGEEGSDESEEEK